MPSGSTNPKTEEPARGIDPSMVFFSSAGNARLEKMASASLKKMSKDLCDEFKMLDKQMIEYKRTHCKEVENIKRQHKSLLVTSGNFEQKIPKIYVDESFIKTPKSEGPYRRRSTPRPRATTEDLLPDDDSPEQTPLNFNYLCPPNPRRYRRARSLPETDLKKLTATPRASEDASRLPFSIPKRISNSDVDLASDSSESSLGDDPPNEQKRHNRRLSLPSVATGRPSVRFAETTTVIPDVTTNLTQPQRIRSGRRASLPVAQARLLTRESLKNSLPCESNENSVPSETKNEVEDEEVVDKRTVAGRQRTRRSMSIGYLPSIASASCQTRDARRRSLEEVHEGASVVNLELNVQAPLQNKNLSYERNVRLGKEKDNVFIAKTENNELKSARNENRANLKKKTDGNPERQL